jgi:large subunit ribosomal protein L25
MIDHSQIDVVTRTERGKNAARRLRVTGQVPATVYGLGKDPDSISLNTKSMVNILNDQTSRNRVFDLTGGSTGPVMAVAWQSDPVTGKLLHVDMRRVDMAQNVRVKVPITLTGEAYGVKTEGGIVDVILRELEIACLPNEVPSSVVIDISEMRAGSSVRVSDLPEGEKYTITSKSGMTVMRLVGKRTDDEEEAEEAAAAEASAAAAAAAAAAEGDSEES